MNKVTTVGIDLAKNVLSVHEIDKHGEVLIRQTIRCDRLMAAIAQLEPCMHDPGLKARVSKIRLKPVIVGHPADYPPARASATRRPITLFIAAPKSSRAGNLVSTCSKLVDPPCRPSGHLKAGGLRITRGRTLN